MRNAGALHADVNEVLLGVLGRLAGGFRNFGGLANTAADAALAVADDNQSGKAEVTTALNNLGHAIDGNHLLLELALRAAVTTRTALAALAALLQFLFHILRHFLNPPLNQKSRPASRAPAATSATRPV